MRKLDFRNSISLAIAATVFVSSLGNGEIFAQKGRLPFSQRNRTAAANAQPPAGPPSFGVLSEDLFQEKLDKAIEVTSKRHMTANSHSPWQIFHGVLALRKECQLRLDHDKVNAIEWISTSEPQFNKQPWMFVTPHGAKFHPYNGVKYHFEGHPGQFLALLSESDLPLSHEIKVEGKTVTLNDVVNNTMKEVNSREEVTWVLWALQHYLKPDAQWQNQAKEPWSIEKLVQIESAAPVIDPPCGGNHRLFALTRARDKYLKNGGRLRGVWIEADLKINKHIEIARSLQNRDGSFSSDFYKGPNQTTDINPRFNASGHTMEFLAVSLPKERLNEPWVKAAVWVLSTELIYYQNNEIDAGPLFHTLDALILYRERIRQVEPGKVPDPSSAEPLITSKPSADLPGNGLGSTPLPNSVSDTAKLKTDKNGGSNSTADASKSDSIPLPSNEGVVVPNSKTAEIKPDPLRLTMPRVLNPKTGQGLAQKTVPKLDPLQLNDVGAPIPGPLVADDKTRSPAPNLLPETSSRPLLFTEKSAPLPKASDQGSAKMEWRNTPSERQGEAESPADKPTATGSKAVEEARRTASALEPANL